MDDREMLEFAAKAAGIELSYWISNPGGEFFVLADDGPEWNPLTDDGDALRLAVKLELHVFGSRIGCSINEDLFVDAADCGDDPCAATRRAIVRAAAEIGKAKEG